MTSLQPSPLFSDGAVLCHGKRICLFGQAHGNAPVRACLSDREGHILGEGEARPENGRFEIILPPQQPGEDRRLTFESGGETVRIEHVAVGEVYLAGGQSNMELALCNADEGPEEAAATVDPLLRFFNVPRIPYPDPELEGKLSETRWQSVSPETSGNDSAVAFFFGKSMRRRHPEMPVGIIGCYWGGTSVTCWMDTETLETLKEGIRYLRDYEKECAGKTMEQYLKEEKAFQDALDAWNRQVEEYRRGHPGAPWPEISDACGLCPWFPPAGPGSPYRPAGLVETMLRPVSRMTLTAILYYQGEADAALTDHYDELMAAMIALWRRMMKDEELPFLFVQLPMWLDFGAADTFHWPKTRLAQAKVRDTVANTGMICLLDEGEYGNIHPTCKRPVGERLAELACAMLYGKGELSPRAIRAVRAGDAVEVMLSAPVFARDGEAALLEIAGEDGVFCPAEGEMRGSAIRIHADNVPEPVSVRYAWTDYSDRVNLFGENGLPLEPFRLQAEKRWKYESKH